MKKLNLFLLLTLLTASASGLNAQQVETVIQTGHYASVTAVCFSPDGRFAATGSSDKTVKLWQRKDGREVRTYQGIASTVIQLSFSRNSSFLLSVGSNGFVTIWDVATGRIIRQISPDDDRFTCAAFHPDGSRIVTGKRKSPVETWDIKTGNRLAVYKAVAENLYSEKGFEYPGAASVMYSSDGVYILAGAADQTAILWDAASGKEIRKYKKVRSTCTTCITEAVISPDNKYIISAYSDSVKVFDRESGKLLKKFYGQGGSFENLSISSDGKYVAAVEYGVAEVWDFNSGKIVHKSGNYSSRKVLSAAISPDSKDIITGNEKRSADILSIAG